MTTEEGFLFHGGRGVQQVQDWHWPGGVWTSRLCCNLVIVKRYFCNKFVQYTHHRPYHLRLQSSIYYSVFNIYYLSACPSASTRAPASHPMAIRPSAVIDFYLFIWTRWRVAFIYLFINVRFKPNGRHAIFSPFDKFKFINYSIRYFLFQTLVTASTATTVT